MDETTFRILDALTRNLGRALSIQELTGEIRRLHGSAYYANTHRRVQVLQKQGILGIARSGRTAAVSLDFRRYALMDSLTEMELRRKQAIMARAKRAEGTFEALDRTLRGLPVRCACTIDTGRNLRLRRVELLVLAPHPEALEIPRELARLGRHANLRIDHLALSPAELSAFLGRDDRNPLPEMMGSALALYLPQPFWATLADAASRGQRIRADRPTDLRRVTEADLAHNLARLGYPLLGGPETGPDLSIEATVTAALLSETSRIRAGAAVLLAKNGFHPRLLAFLALKHGVAGELLGILGTLKARPHVKDLRTRLERTPVKAVGPDAAAVKRTMEVYDAG